ncbi:MAG: 2-succinyl-5-enolpyruvyl-6-hydroxy-3-cyclohexene-1-carboxylic-acid synthase [Chloroflexota bacterium]
MDDVLTAPSYATVAYLVDELVRSGVQNFSVCPGSRSTPLAISAARHPTARVWMHLDERSAGFFGLGLAMATRSPVALICSSGTAAANFMPAVIEAFQSRVPLIVLTADRPQEMQDCGALQTIDQVRLYGSCAKWFANVPQPVDEATVVRYTRAVACRAATTAVESPAGPVHLNCPYSEPLLPAEDLWSSFEQAVHLEPYVTVRTGLPTLSATEIDALVAELRGKRGVIVCGPTDQDSGFPSSVARMAKTLGFPILADPLSSVRCGQHDRQSVIDTYDLLLRSDEVAGRLAPEVVLRFGGYPTSKALQSYMERFSSARQIVVDGGCGWRDPDHLRVQLFHAGETWLCQAVASAAFRLTDPTDPPGWLALWREANALAGQALAEELAARVELSEGKVFAELAQLLPDESVLYVGNSMPMRDVDSFFHGSDRRIRILGNRGASGIDGVVSSALGAAAGLQRRVFLVIGDVSFYHDLNGLLAAKRHGLHLTIILVNNEGGGIFNFLQQATATDHDTFELLFGTPHGIDFEPIIGAFGGTYVRVSDWADFRQAIGESSSGGLWVIEIRTERKRNVTWHQELWRAVSERVQARFPAHAVCG